MPRCCVPTQVQFNNATSTSIIYNAAMLDRYGPIPRLFTYYFDPATGEFLLSNFFTVNKFINGNQIVVDHGGPQTGIIVVT